MKPHTYAVALGVLALGLVGTIAYVQKPAAPVLPSPSISPVPEVSSPNAAPLPAAAKPPSRPAFSWSQVESEDYQKYVANLRAIGCPEQTIRDIILADLNKLYAPKEEALKNPAAGNTNAPPETLEQRLTRLQQLRDVQQEKRWVVKELLGIDLPLDLLPSTGTRDYHAFEVALKFLPLEKRDAVQALQETYWQQSDALKSKYDKKKTPEFLAEARQLSESLRQELSKVLTPEELEDYDMRTSSDAKQLSTKLATYFRPSEDEFRNIFRAKQAYDDAIQKLASPAPQKGAIPTDPEQRTLYMQQRAAERQALDQARTAAATQMNEQLKSTLGEDRYNEYQRSQDRTYDLLARLGARYNLPQEKVLEAYDLQKSFQLNAGLANGAPAPQPADRADLQRQLNEQLTSILGEQAARGYRRVNGGAVKIK